MNILYIYIHIDSTCERHHHHPLERKKCTLLSSRIARKITEYLYMCKHENLAIISITSSSRAPSVGVRSYLSSSQITPY